MGLGERLAAASRPGGGRGEGSGTRRDSPQPVPGSRSSPAGPRREGLEGPGENAADPPLPILAAARPMAARLTFGGEGLPTAALWVSREQLRPGPTPITQLWSGLPIHGRGQMLRGSFLAESNCKMPVIVEGLPTSEQLMCNSVLPQINKIW